MNNMSYDVLFHSHYIDVYINVTIRTCQVYDLNLIVVGDINFPFIIGLVSLITPLFVINKEINSNLLLGKPLIHCMHIVPSSLYLCIYFLFKGKVILINSNPLLPLFYCTYHFYWESSLQCYGDIILTNLQLVPHIQKSQHLLFLLLNLQLKILLYLGFLTSNLRSYYIQDS